MSMFNKILSLAGLSQEKEVSISRKEDAQPPDSSPNTPRKDTPQPAPSRSLNSRGSTAPERDASRRQNGSKKSTVESRATSDERRLLGDHRSPADATYIQAPRSTPPPNPTNMPPNKYYQGGGSIAGRNTLYDKRKTQAPHKSKEASALTTHISGGGKIRHPAPQLCDFEDPREPHHKRRKIDDIQPLKKKPEISAVIDLDDGEDDHSPRNATEKASKSTTKKDFRVPPPFVTGVEESRKVDRIVSSSQASHNVSSQRPQARHMRGHTHSQPVILEDDSQTLSTHAYDKKSDIMTPLDNSLKAELLGVRSQNKKRQGSEIGATISRYFSDSKRPKPSISDLVIASDDELEEVSRPLTNGAKKNGRVLVRSENLRGIFVPDNRVSQPDRSAFGQNEEDENMVDELAETPEKHKNPDESTKQINMRPSSSEPSEIAETPPKDDYISAADIPPTSFKHAERVSVKKGKLAKEQISKAHGDEIYPLISYKDGRTNIPESQSGSELRYADGKREFELFFGNEPTVATINPAKVKVLQWSDEGCNLVRVQGVREHNTTLMWDLKFEDVADVKKFVLRLREVAQITQIPRSPGTMRKMFNTFPAQRSRTEQATDVVDPETEDKLLESRVSNFHSAEKQLGTQRSLTTHQRPHRKSTLVSQLVASVPDDVQQEKREQSLPGKHGNEKEALAVNERPKRATRAAKASVRSPTPEIEKYSIKHGLGEPWDQPVVYPGREKPYRSKKQVSVEFEDLHRLDEGEWFNDSLVEYCLLHYQQQNERQASKVYFFSNFFYSKLIAKGRSIDYEAVQRWVKEDIFTYDFVVVPVCENAHWYLALICNLSQLKRTLAEDDGIAKEVEIDSLEHEGQTEKLASTSAPEGTASKTEHHQTHQAKGEKGLESPSGKPELKNHKDEDVMDLVGGKSKTKQLSEPNVGADADSVSGNHATTTRILSTKKKTKRQPSVRKYPPDTPAIAILDSMPSGAKHNNTINALKDFLIAEADFKRGMSVTRENFKGMHVTRGIPMQDNFSDCGLFLCRYVCELLKDPEGFAGKLFGSELGTIEWGSWDTNQVRATIRNQLQDLATEQSKQRKEAKAEKRRAKRAAQPNVSIHTATEALSNTSADLPPLSPTKASSSPVKASNPVISPRLRELSVVLDSPIEPMRSPRSPSRTTNPVLRSSSTSKASRTSHRGVSDEPRYSNRSSPVVNDVYSAQDTSIPIDEDDAVDLTPEREPREDSEDVMLYDEQLQGRKEEAEQIENEVAGSSDSEQLGFKGQLWKAANSYTVGEKKMENDRDRVEESPTVSDTPERSQRSWEPAVRSHGPKKAPKIPALPYG